MQAPPERLGSFYLGAEYDLASGQRLETPVNYDARDLTTHAVCVGMTGSGKTGLCLSLLEEAALDKVPTILIDPKGDITNLLLQFPNLLPEDFKPWVNIDDARRKGQSLDEYAAATAKTWRDGLAEWGIGPERLKLLQDTTDFTIYTPGSDAGVSVSIMGSLAAPGLDFETEGEAIRERISGTVAALLGLVGINADPLRSREAILLSNIFEHFWRQNKNLDLGTLIMSIQKPRCASWASLMSIPSSRKRTVSAWRWNLTTCWPRPASATGWRATRWTSTRCSLPPRANPATPFSTSPTCQTASGCFLSPCCWKI
jgi:hypothetical protein